MTIVEKREKIKNYCNKRNACTTPDICPLYHCSGDCYSDITLVDKKYEILFGTNNLENDKNDPVNSPSHYNDGKIEVIDYIEDKKLGFCLGNAVKYISRAGKKDPTKEVEDLKKARWYIERRIIEIEEALV